MSDLPAPTNKYGLDAVPCHYCDDPVRLIPHDWEPGDPVYCTAHRFLEGRDPTLVIPDAIKGAVADLEAPTDHLVDCSLPEMTDTFGYLLPGTVNYACAFPKNGKTAFLSNQLHYWNSKGLRVWVMPTESRPKGLIARMACFRCGVSPDEVMSRRLAVRADQGDAEAQRLYQLVLDTYVAMMEETQRDGSNIMIEPTPRLTRSVFRRSCEAAAVAGVDLVVTDHVDHVGADPDGGLSGYAASEAVQHDALEAAERFGYAVLLMSQLNSSRVSNDKLHRYRRPIPDWLWMKGAKDQVVTTMIGIYRPMKPDIDDKLLMAVREGHEESWRVALPHTMGLVDMLSRFNGAKLDRGLLVDFRDGVMRSRDPGDDFDLLADRHGIPTGSPSDRWHNRRTA